jgi:mxaD protein
MSLERGAIMRRFLQFALTFAAFAMLAVPLLAHGPTPQKVDETITIAAPPEAVWNLVKDFAAISAWHPDVASSAGRGGNEAGGERDVVLKSGGQLTDSLDEYEANDMTYSYRLAKENIDAIPVSFYSATLQVKPGANGGSEVEWLGRFYRADTGNEPPPEKNDEAAIAAMSKFFHDGLEGLKQKAENK